MEQKNAILFLLAAIAVVGVAVGGIVWNMRQTSSPSLVSSLSSIVGRSSSTTASGNNFQYGETVTSTVGAQGGTLENADRSIVVTVPPGALTQATTVTLSFKKSDFPVVQGVGSPVTFTIAPDVTFKVAVSVKVTYDAAYQLPLPYLIDSQNKLRAVDLTNLDKANHNFVMSTFHGGDYSWIYASSSSIQ